MRQDLFRIQNGCRLQNKMMVLQDIQIELQPGEVQGVFFENRNEEESLMQVLCGDAKLTGGQFYYKDKYCDIKKARQLLKENIFMPVFRKQWADELTVTDFFCLHEQRLNTRKKLVEKKIRTLSEIFELKMQPDQKVHLLSAVQKVEMELIRAYERGYSVVILRGLTAILGKDAFLQIMKLVGKLQKQNIGFLILDHAEILARYCTADIYAISRGRTVFIYEKRELKEYLDVKFWKQNRTGQDTGWNGEVLQIRGLKLDDKVSVDLSVYTGEIVTVLDTKDIYVNSLAAVLRGEHSYEKGNIWFRGIPFAPENIQETIHKGIGVIEEREGAYGQELFYNLSAAENLELLMAEKESARFMKKSRRRSIIKESERFFTEQELNTMVSRLQPRQRQRLAYYRWYLFYPQLIICIRPLTSLDLQMRKEAEGMIRKFQERGIAVLVLTANAIAAEVLGGRQIIL